jgi:bacterioferritin
MEARISPLFFFGDFMNSTLVAGLTHLSQLLTSTLQQLRIHKAMALNWGYPGLVNVFQEQWVHNSHHLDNLLERFVALDQTIDLQNLAKINVGQTVEEMLQSTGNNAKAAVEVCQKILETILFRDQTTYHVVELILLGEEKRLSQCNQLIEMIRQMGTQNFLLKMSS